MTKDSGVTTLSNSNSNWITNDTSAGRLISGTVATPLASGDVVKVYANGTLIGNATVNAAGTAWEITDTAGYNASWVYSANIVSASGTSTTAFQPVTADLTEAAPVITGVFDTANSTTTIANNGTTTKALSAVKGTGLAGDTIYLYDNTYTNLVGTAVVDGSGNWSVTSLTGTFNGSNTFVAKQLDVNGNLSVTSNVWTVTSSGTNMLANGDFTEGVTGFNTALTKISGDPAAGSGWIGEFNIMTLADADRSVNTSTMATTIQSAVTPYTYGNWSKKTGAVGNPDGTMTDPVFAAQVNSSAGFPYTTIWTQNVDVEAGKSYTFTMDYNIFQMGGGGKSLALTIDGQYLQIVSAGGESGHLLVTYTAPTTKSIALTLTAQNDGTANGGDLVLDNIKFAQDAPANTLLPNVNGAATPNPDTLTYTGGALDAMASDDTINVTGTDVQALLSNGGYIHGGAGVDTLKLAASTVLNLDNLTKNQTVQELQQVEVFQLQGGSTLTLTANDVLSLGGANASTMSAYSFSSTSGGTASATSTGKVQFVVNALNSTDTVNLATLTNDGVTTNGTLGNTGLAGTWADMGTTQIGSMVYKVYNHSTTQAQVLVANATVATPTSTQSVAITRADSSMAATSVVEEFVATGTTPVNVIGSSIDTAAWNISVRSILGTPTAVNELKLTTGPADPYYSWFDTLMGTDAKLELGYYGSPANTTAPRLNTFTPKAGEFSAISFKYTNLYHSTSSSTHGGSKVKFFDADGMLVATDIMVATTYNTLQTYSYTLPAGVKAASFTLETNSNGFWVMDSLAMTPVDSTFLPHTSTTADATPLLSGTYAANLSAGDVIKIYDASGATYLGDAVVDAANKTWTYQITTPQTVGADTYQAKIVNGTTNVATSNNYTLNLTTTPLVLDLNGDGVQTLSLDDGVQFDLLNTGSKQSVGWVDKHDGLLVMDLNGDGMINSGAELFGDHTQLADGSLAKDGWAALAALDSNADGLIDAKDAAFNALNVWVDANSDGVSAAAELYTLNDLGINAIGLNTTYQQVAQNGNILGDKGQFTTVDGQSHDVVDAWFKVNVTDVLMAPADGVTQSVPVNGEPVNGNTLNLHNLLSADAAPTQLTATGTVQQNSHAYTSQVDATLQALLDQQQMATS
jgi:hypothetical protein